jgi:hypothetical protein
MGVRVLAHTAGTSESLDGRLAELGCQRISRWQLSCTYFLPSSQGGMGAPSLAELFMFQSSERPQQQYVLSQGVLLEAGQDIAAVIEEMGTHAKKLKVIAEGSAHECGDLYVRVGKLFLNATLYGTVLEVEFRPCSLSSGATVPLLREFVDMCLPPIARDFCSTEASFREAHDLPSHFDMKHSACQFVSLMRSLRPAGRA